MQPHAARGADRLKPPLGRQAALVEGMPGLVQCAHQRLREIRLIVARGQSDIVRDAAAERMRALVEPTMREIEADPLHQGQRGAALGGERERSLRLGRRRARALTGERVVEEPR